MKKFLFISLLAMMTVSARAQYTNYGLFNGGHQDAPFGLVLGYVNKGWSTDFGSYTWHENLWGEKDKKLHGIQIGFQYAPCLPIGLGLDTGLFYECYISDSKVVHDYDFDNFSEHNLYVPIHAQWRFPLSRDISFSVFGGIGLQWAMYGSYNCEYGEVVYDWSYGRPYYRYVSYPEAWQQYGKGEWPHHFNLQWEVGGRFRVKNFQISASYAFGATNHDFYEGYKTRQNKLSIGLGYVFDLDD